MKSFWCIGRYRGMEKSHAMEATTILKVTGAQ